MKVAAKRQIRNLHPLAGTPLKIVYPWIGVLLSKFRCRKKADDLTEPLLANHCPNSKFA